MGAVFELALARAPDVSQLPGRTVALVADRGRPLSEVDFHDVTLMIGAEREGLPAGLSAVAGEIARIPIQSHSLNAAMAATVALYEASRMAR